MKPTLLATWGKDGPRSNEYRLIGEGPAGESTEIDSAIVEYRTEDSLGGAVWLACDDFTELQSAFIVLARHLRDGGLLKS